MYCYFLYLCFYIKTNFVLVNIEGSWEIYKNQTAFQENIKTEQQIVVKTENDEYGKLIFYINANFFNENIQVSKIKFKDTNEIIDIIISCIRGRMKIIVSFEKTSSIKRKITSISLNISEDKLYYFKIKIDDHFFLSDNFILNSLRLKL